ncbi:radical SAM protein [Streptomyces sp. NPDC059441]|uniref:radical SAM protein n=1 Tax=Streptomyces sp. NPDC059441 TaxID=3346829 RepID=UPI0036B4B5D5
MGRRRDLDEPVPDRYRRELDTAAAEDLLDQVAASGQPAPLFLITVGDPFQRPDLIELIAYARKIGVRVAVAATGATKVAENQLRAVAAAGAVELALGLDGSTAALHDDFHRAPGAFHRVLDAWDAALALGLKVRINTTIDRRNLDDLPGVVRVVAERGASLWNACFPTHIDRARPLGMLAAHEVEDLLSFVYDMCQTVSATTTDARHLRRVALQRRILADLTDDHVAALGLGRLYQELADSAAALGLYSDRRRTRRPLLEGDPVRECVFVSYAGSVHPSGSLPVSAGNVRERSLMSTYRTSPLFTGLRADGMLGGRCGRCEFRRVCGGSRSRAYYMTGNPFAEESLCGYIPGSFVPNGLIYGPRLYCWGSNGVTHSC